MEKVAKVGGGGGNTVEGLIGEEVFILEVVLYWDEDWDEVIS